MYKYQGHRPPELNICTVWSFHTLKMDTGLQFVSEEFKSSLWKAGYNAKQLPLCGSR